MEYSNSEKHENQIYSCPSKAGTPDILTQSLTSVFAPATPQSHEEVYAVPIQRYPDFTVTAAQNTTTVATGAIQGSGTAVTPGDNSHRVSPGDQDNKAIPPDSSSSGDLISEAWSLSCDMTRAWQKADQQVSSNPPNEAPASVNLTQDPVNLPINDSEVNQKVPETISVNNIEIPVQDCVMVDSQDDSTTSASALQDKPSCDKESECMQSNTGESHQDCTENDEPVQESHDMQVCPQQQVDVSVVNTRDEEVNKENQVQEVNKENQVQEVNKENQVQANSAHTEADNRADEVQVQHHLTKAAQSPEKIKQVDDKKSENSYNSQLNDSDLPKSPVEVETPESKRQRVKSGDSSNSTTPARSSDCSERPQRKRKLPQKLCDDSVIKDSRETSFILKEHSKSLIASKATSTSKNSTEDAEAERLKQQKLKQFQRMYVMSQRGYIPEKPTDKIDKVEDSPPDSTPVSPESSSPRRTFSLMDIGISLNAKGEVTLSMPDDIKKLAKSGGSININFDVDCLDEENCLKFKVTEDKEAITTALGTSDNHEVPLIESEASSEHDRSESPKIKTETEEMSQPTESTNVISSNDLKPSRDSSVQVDLNVTNSEEDYLNEKLMRASTATGFVSYPRFTQVTGSSLATVHKVLKNVKKGLSIDKLTKKPTWFCSLCNLTGDYGDMGPLFGPFDIYVPPKSSYRNKNMSEGAKNLFEKLSSTFNKDLTFNDETEITVEREEVWLHEDCICWSPGVYMIGFDIYGLEEIFKVARFTVCSDCGEIGASLGCFKEGCSNRYHYRCSIKAKCKLIKTTFTVLCPTHSHGVVDNCLAVKPLMKVRNYLSQEEINESEELLSRRPGDDAREFAVKITKTRIIRSRKNKKTKEKKRSAPAPARKVVEEKEDSEGQASCRKRGRPRIHPREVLEEDEEEEAEEDGEDQGDEEENENGRITYECFGCGSLFIRMTSIRRHFKAYPSCRSPHIERCIDNGDDLPPHTQVCFSCGHYVHAGKMIGHLNNVPKQRCMGEHIRVIRDVKGLDVKEYFAEDKKKNGDQPHAQQDESDYKCFGCFHPCGSRKNLRVHLNCRQECRRKNLKYLIVDNSQIPSKYKICFGCGNLILKSSSMSHHYNKQFPKHDCRKGHERVMKEKRAKISANDQGSEKNGLQVEVRVVDGKDERQEKDKEIIDAEDDNEEGEVEEHDHEEDTATLRLYCCHGHHKYAKTYNMHRHLRQHEACLDPHIQGFLKSGDRVLEGWLFCINCGCYVRRCNRENHLYRSDRGCADEHLSVGGEDVGKGPNDLDAEKNEDRDEDIMEVEGKQERQSKDQESTEAEEIEEGNLEEGGHEKDTATWRLYCSHKQNTHSRRHSLHRHLRRNKACVDPHIRGFFISGDRAPDGWVFCLNCGYYVKGETRESHLNRVGSDCKAQHFIIRGNLGRSGGRDKGGGVESTADQEDVEMKDVEEEIEEVNKSPDQGDVKEEKEEEEKEADVVENEKKPVRVKVEMIASSALPNKDSSSSSSPSLSASPTDTAVITSSKSPGDCYIHCSQCETKTKDRAYLKKHYRAQHCPVGCGDYDLICTVCVKALKKIVTFPRGLEGYDYSPRMNSSKEGLKCPECSTVSQKHNTHYIRSHYREQHCKIGCAKYDQICTACVAVLEKLTDWPKPLIGHDYSTGPPPVGFQCPKCRKGIDRQYFKRHYRHLHCKVHCIEKDGVCKKCFLVFKRMNMLSKSDGPGIDYRVK